MDNNMIPFNYETTRNLLHSKKRINVIDATTGEFVEECVSVYPGGWDINENGGFINIERAGEIGVFEYNLPAFFIEKWQPSSICD